MSAIRSVISNVCHDKRGSTGIIFALAFVPTILLAGGAVDVGNVYNQRMRLQGAADAAVLAANRLSEATESERQSMALKVFQSNTSDNVRLASVAPTITVTGNNITLDATTSVPTPGS